MEEAETGSSSAVHAREASILAQDAVAADRAGESGSAIALYSRAVESLSRGLAFAEQEGADTSKLLRYSRVYRDRIADLTSSCGGSCSARSASSTSSGAATGWAAEAGPAGPSGDADYDGADIEAATPTRASLPRQLSRDDVERSWPRDAGVYDDGDLEAATPTRVDGEGAASDEYIFGTEWRKPLWLTKVMRAGQQHSPTQGQEQQQRPHDTCSDDRGTSSSSSIGATAAEALAALSPRDRSGPQRLPPVAKRSGFLKRVDQRVEELLNERGMSSDASSPRASSASPCNATDINPATPGRPKLACTLHPCCRNSPRAGAEPSQQLQSSPRDGHPSSAAVVDAGWHALGAAPPPQSRPPPVRIVEDDARPPLDPNRPPSIALPLSSDGDRESKSGGPHTRAFYMPGSSSSDGMITSDSASGACGVHSHWGSSTPMPPETPPGSHSGTPRARGGEESPAKCNPFRLQLSPHQVHSAAQLQSPQPSVPRTPGDACHDTGLHGASPRRSARSPAVLSMESNSSLESHRIESGLRIHDDTSAALMDASARRGRGDMGGGCDSGSADSGVGTWWSWGWGWGSGDHNPAEGRSSGSCDDDPRRALRRPTASSPGSSGASPTIKQPHELTSTGDASSTSDAQSGGSSARSNFDELTPRSGSRAGQRNFLSRTEAQVATPRGEANVSSGEYLGDYEGLDAHWRDAASERAASRPAPADGRAQAVPSPRPPTRQASITYKDGSEMVVPRLQVSHASGDGGDGGGSTLAVILASVPDNAWPPPPFWFHSVSDDERAALVVQRYIRAYLERRMINYLQTMRRLINILATRERKAARLIRERWLTKAILEKNSKRLRPVLEALLASICRDKPDRLLDYATEWMRTSYPDQAQEAAAVDCMCEWAPRTDVEPTQEGLMAYLEETNATAILEGIIERAISAQPANVTAYVVDELVALNDDVRIPNLDGRGSDDDASERGSVKSSEAALDAEEEELLLDEEEQLLEEEEMLVDDEEEQEAATDLDDARPAVGFRLPLGPLATLEEDDEDEDDDDEWQRGVRS